MDYELRVLKIGDIIHKYKAGINYRKEEAIYHPSCIILPNTANSSNWGIEQKSLFIESILWKVPIPFISVKENMEANWEVIDGSKRIKTLSEFENNEFELSNLKKIDSLNGFRFRDLDDYVRSKFLRTQLPIMLFSRKTEESLKRDIFNRINQPLLLK